MGSRDASDLTRVSICHFFSLSDKNPDNIEECNRLFHAIQNAYEVLSDPQERAW